MLCTWLEGNVALNFIYWCIAQFSCVINATTATVTSGCEARAHPGAQVKCELQGADCESHGCLACSFFSVFAFLPSQLDEERTIGWPDVVWRVQRFWPIWDGKFLFLLSLHISWKLPVPPECMGVFLTINSQLFIQREISPLHNIFSYDYLWGSCLDSSSCFSVPLPGTKLFHLHFPCFLVSYRCWGSAENGRRFSSPHGPQYGDRSDPCSGKMCSFCWPSKGHNKKKTVERL